MYPADEEISHFSLITSSVISHTPLLSDLPHSRRPLLLVLLLLGALLGGVPLHALGDGLVVLGDVVEQPLQALLDGLVHLFAAA